MMKPVSMRRAAAQSVDEAPRGDDEIRAPRGSTASPKGRSARARGKGEAISSRYELLLRIGSGGMASVYVGRLFRNVGFSRLVAVKRAHPHLVHDSIARRCLLREAQLASRLTHANVAAVLDVERSDDELLLIMDYVEGASLDELIAAGVRAEKPLPAPIALRIVLDACAGLTAAHELGDDEGRPLGFLHRDVSPHNILVGVDGTARIGDFGLARGLTGGGASSSLASLGGKLAYAAPEVIEHACYSVKSDLFAVGVVVWEALAGRRLFRSASEGDTARRVLSRTPPSIGDSAPALAEHFDAAVQQALEKDVSRRYASVRQLMAALEAAARDACGIATSSEVSAYVRSVVGEDLALRRERLRAIESAPRRPSASPRGARPSPMPPFTAAPVNEPPQQAPAEPASSGPPSGIRRISMTEVSVAPSELPVLPFTPVVEVVACSPAKAPELVEPTPAPMSVSTNASDLSSAPISAPVSVAAPLPLAPPRARAGILAALFAVILGSLLAACVFFTQIQGAHRPPAVMTAMAQAQGLWARLKALPRPAAHPPAPAPRPAPSPETASR